MNKLDKIFNTMLESWRKVKDAKNKHRLGAISNDELFDIEFYAYEIEEKFIKHLQK
jgi:hypothetical protein